MEHLVAQRLRRGELSRVDLPGCRMDACWHVTVLERQHRSAAVSSFRRYLGTPEAMHLMRSPAGGVPPSRFRPPVYVTIWSLDQLLRSSQDTRNAHLKQALIRLLRGTPGQRIM